VAIDFEALLRTFLAEAGESLSALEQNLLVLEREPADRERLDEVFRLVHTLKGDAGSLGFPILARFAHELEDHLERLRRGESQLTESQATKLLEAVDALRDLLANAAAREEIERPEDRALLDALTAPPSASSTTENEAASTPLAAARGARTTSGTTGTNQTLRVPIERLDALLDLAGEMGIARRRLERSLADPNTARDVVVELHREHERLQSTLEELVMALRLVPIGPTLERFERDVRDLAHAHGKRATLTIEGEATEVDTRVVERLRDPLLHMIRNAIDHGIETPAVRAAAGKAPSGAIHLAARREGASIAIELSDDGRGLDRARILAKARASGLVGAGEEPNEGEIDQLILLPGFSTAEEVSELSGRGVGLDVVKKNVASLRGTVAIESRPGAGTAVTLRLPLTLARIEGFAVGVGDETYVVPLESVATILDLPSSAPRETETGLFEHEGQILPFVRLGRRLAAPEQRHSDQRERVLVVERAAGRFGLVVDELRGQEPTVVKPLPSLFFGLPGLLGSTLLADGSVAFILDLESLAPTTGRRSTRKDAS
jgi:two-component system, chemotaxis family, sensor kinase CheA